MTDAHIAKLMWGAYATQAGGKTFDGKPLPSWEELGGERQSCWVAAAFVAADRIEQLEAANLKAALIKVDDMARIEQLEAALREIAGNGNATGCNPQIMCDIARCALDAK